MNYTKTVLNRHRTLKGDWTVELVEPDFFFDMGTTQAPNTDIVILTILLTPAGKADIPECLHLLGKLWEPHLARKRRKRMLALIHQNQDREIVIRLEAAMAVSVIHDWKIRQLGRLFAIDCRFEDEFYDI